MLDSIAMMISPIFYLICFLSSATSTSPSIDSPMPISHEENVAKFLFTNSFNGINNVDHRLKFRKPPDYVKSLFRLLNKAIANEESNNVFTETHNPSTVNSDLKIQIIWPSKVLQTNSTISFLYTRLNIAPPLQAQLVLRPRKTVNEFITNSPSKVNHQIFDVTDKVNYWFEQIKAKDEQEPLILIVRVETQPGGPSIPSYKGFLVLYYGIDHWQLVIASLRPPKHTRPSIGRNRVARNANEKCQLHDWYVSFDDLGWSSWVMAPSGFYANSCSGDCPPILLPEEYHASNHAMLRGLYRGNQPEHKAKLVNAACCVPTRLRATSLIYLDDGGITMRKLNNIIAEECGCQ